MLIKIICSQNLASNNIIKGLIEKIAPNSVCLIYIGPNIPANSSAGIRRAFRLALKASFYFTLFKIIEIYVHGFLAFILNKNITSLCKKNNINFIKFKSFDSNEFQESFFRERPDYILSAGPLILNKKILDHAILGTLNCHCAKLPDFMGAANYIWMKLENVDYAFVSIQKMNLDLDSGPLLYEYQIKINKDWSAYKLNFLISKIAGNRYGYFVNKLINNPSLLSNSLAEKNTAFNRGIPDRNAMNKFFKKNKLFNIMEIFTCT